MITGDARKPLVDWGMAETLAFGTLLSEGGVQGLALCPLRSAGRGGSCVASREFLGSGIRYAQGLCSLFINLRLTNWCFHRRSCHALATAALRCDRCPHHAFVPAAAAPCCLTGGRTGWICCMAVLHLRLPEKPSVPHASSDSHVQATTCGSVGRMSSEAPSATGTRRCILGESLPSAALGIMQSMSASRPVQFASHQGGLGLLSVHEPCASHAGSVTRPFHAGVTAFRRPSPLHCI